MYRTPSDNSTSISRPSLLNRIKKQSPAGAAQTVVTRERVELWVDSEILASATRLPASFFYGVARVKGLKAPRSIATFVALEDKDVSTALREAVRKRLIPALSFDLAGVPTATAGRPTLDGSVAFEWVWPGAQQ